MIKQIPGLRRTLLAATILAVMATAIQAEPAGQAHINDFAGKRVGVVRGMAAERDVRRRAPEGVIIVATESFAQLYEQFAEGRLDAIAEAEYYSLDGRIIPSHGDDVVLADLHDLVPGQREESAFAVSDGSTNLLSAVNAFIARTPFPL